MQKHEVGSKHAWDMGKAWQAMAKTRFPDCAQCYDRPCPSLILPSPRWGMKKKRLCRKRHHGIYIIDLISREETSEWRGNVGWPARRGRAKDGGNERTMWGRGASLSWPLVAISMYQNIWTSHIHITSNLTKDQSTYQYIPMRGTRMRNSTHGPARGAPATPVSNMMGNKRLMDSIQKKPSSLRKIPSVAGSPY